MIFRFLFTSHFDKSIQSLLYSFHSKKNKNQNEQKCQKSQKVLLQCISQKTIFQQSHQNDTMINHMENNPQKLTLYT